MTYSPTQSIGELNPQSWINFYSGYYEKDIERSSLNE
jgi:hypothetical protein